MLNQNHMPIYEHLKQHSKQDTARYHIPGHQGGDIYDLPCWKEIAKWDVTETIGMDDLHSPHSIIKEAEQLAADAFGASKSYFLINGTSSGLLASIHALFRHGDTVLVQRNAHKSIYNSMLLLGVEPKYLMPEKLIPETIAGVVTPESLGAAIAEYPQAKGVIITSPTFYGHSADIKKLAELCKNHNMLLLVDSAHGAHYSFHSKLKKNAAIYQGADVVVQSIHKTLPALTMGSMLHVSETASSRIDRDRLSYYLSVFQTTSPSYIVMASLDYARHWAFHNGQEAIEQAYKRKQNLCDELIKLGIRPWDLLWEQTGAEIDPLKLTLPVAALNMNGKELEQKLAAAQIQVELVSADHILLLLGLNMNKNADERLLHELAKYTNQYENNVETNSNHRLYSSVEGRSLRLPQSEPKVVIPFSCISREIQQKTTKSIDIHDCAEKIAAEFVIPYPPGIPLLCPGEMITEEHVEFITKARTIGIHFQGVSDKSFSSLLCYTDTEDRSG